MLQQYIVQAQKMADYSLFAKKKETAGSGQIIDFKPLWAIR